MQMHDVCSVYAALKNYVYMYILRVWNNKLKILRIATVNKTKRYCDDELQYFNLLF